MILEPGCCKIGQNIVVYISLDLVPLIDHGEDTSRLVRRSIKELASLSFYDVDVKTSLGLCAKDGER